MVACTVPLGPIVSLCSGHSTMPSTSPSTYRSSLLLIWPLIRTAFPIVAEPPRVSGSKLLLGIDTVSASFLGSAGAAAVGAGLGLGGLKDLDGSLSWRCLFHI